MLVVLKIFFVFSLSEYIIKIKISILHFINLNLYFLVCAAFSTASRVLELSDRFLDIHKEGQWLVMVCTEQFKINWNFFKIECISGTDVCSMVCTLQKARANLGSCSSDLVRFPY